jgi:hypothetical protein
MRRATRIAILLAAVLGGCPAIVWASAYAGWGDTGWVYASKRDCCNAAIALAQEASMEACFNVGGMPNPMRGARRGTCESTWTQGPEGVLLYRCSSEASVWCR